MGCRTFLKFFRGEGWGLGGASRDLSFLLENSNFALAKAHILLIFLSNSFIHAFIQYTLT